MEQEYLFTSNEKKYDISKVESKNVETEIIDLKQGDCWILRCTTELKSEQGAEALSKIETKISKYNPIIIKTDTSDFYLKKLYPLANEFERKLRKFLYLTNEISPKEKKSDNIKDLELKEFGELFDILFTDTSFIENSKRVAGSLPPKYTKKQLLQALESMTESCLWDKLVKPNAVPTLRNEFERIRKFRNDIMHSHNIDTNTFKEAETLFKSIIKELDTANETIVKPDSISSVANEGFSEKLENALKTTTNSARDLGAAMSYLIPNTADYIVAGKKIRELIPDYKISNGIDLSDITRAAPITLTNDYSSILPTTAFAVKTKEALNSVYDVSAFKGLTSTEGVENNG